MGKVRRDDQRVKQNHKAIPKVASRGIKRRQHSQNGKIAVTDTKGKATKAPDGRSKQSLKLKVPFSKQDRILLVGEGDFSFSFSLAKHYGVASILTTSYDDEKTLAQKYPSAEKVVNALKHATTGLSQGPERQEHSHKVEGEWNGFSSDDESERPPVDEEHLKSARIHILHGIDATALSKKHKKTLDAHAPFTKIVFNFPHTGGLSTDVNRQVRANQELLVGFFNAAKPFLASKSQPAQAAANGTDDSLEYDSEGQEVEHEIDARSLSSGHILVTLFEGEPYTLWNVRDLARHCGLQVVESFKFPWAAYPGYKHARTIGDITSGRDRSEEGKRKGAWRGEERDARCYVLGLKDEVKGNRANRQKRKRENETDDSE